jgi:hypothetical protein
VYSSFPTFLPITPKFDEVNREKEFFRNYKPPSAGGEETLNLLIVV